MYTYMHMQHFAQLLSSSTLYKSSQLLQSTRPSRTTADVLMLHSCPQTRQVLIDCVGSEVGRGTCEFQERAKSRGIVAFRSRLAVRSAVTVNISAVKADSDGNTFGHVAAVCF
jgi:hypothetical protein